jgi:hypothetical protein
MCCHFDVVRCANFTIFHMYVIVTPCFWVGAVHLTLCINCWLLGMLNEMNWVWFEWYYELEIEIINNFILIYLFFMWTSQSNSFQYGCDISFTLFSYKWNTNASWTSVQHHKQIYNIEIEISEVVTQNVTLVLTIRDECTMLICTNRTGCEQ